MACGAGCDSLVTLIQTLTGKQIVVAVCGSIAAVEMVKLIHALRRRGAVVQPVMSSGGARDNSPGCTDLCQRGETITRISGMVEHVQYCGDDGTADPPPDRTLHSEHDRQDRMRY